MDFVDYVSSSVAGVGVFFVARECVRWLKSKKVVPKKAVDDGWSSNWANAEEGHWHHVLFPDGSSHVALVRRMEVLHMFPGIYSCGIWKKITLVVDGKEVVLNKENDEDSFYRFYKHPLFEPARPDALTVKAMSVACLLRKVKRLEPWMDEKLADMDKVAPSEAEIMSRVESSDERLYGTDKHEAYYKKDGDKDNG